MTTSLLPVPIFRAFDTAGLPLAGGQLFSYAAGTLTPQNTYSDSAGSTPNTNPVVLDTTGSATVRLDPTLSYKFVLKDVGGATQWTEDNYQTNYLTASTIGAILYPQTAAEIAAAVTPTNYGYPELNILRYGGAAGSGDNTTAMNRAAAVANQYNGGVIVIPYAGEWRMNWVCTTNGITVQGPGGKGEFDLACIRPFSLSSPPITWGDGVSNFRYGRLVNCHVSGTDGTAQTAAHCAPQALLLNGGTVAFRADDCVFYTGIQTVALNTTVSTPITTNVVFLGCTIRNDNTDSASARAIYMKRSSVAANGSLTSVAFIGTKVNAVNSTAGAYLAEIDGTAAGISFQTTDCYMDFPAAHGVLMKGATNMVTFNTQLDPGTSGVVVLETTDTGQDISRYVVGHLVADGQLFKTAFSGGTTYAIPASTVMYSYGQVIRQPFLHLPLNVATSTNPFSTTITIDGDTDTGPLTFNATDVSVKTVGKGWRTKEGSNAKQGLTGAMTAGTLVVANTSVTANSRIFVTRQDGGTNPGAVYVSARSAGVSFTITSTNGADTGAAAFEIFEPA